MKFLFANIRRKRRRLLLAGAVILLLTGGVALKTWLDLVPQPATLALDPTDIRKVQIRDRHGVPLSVTYQNDFNYHDYALLHEIPRLLQQAFILSEDQRFYRHHGVDWPGRFHAVLQNLRASRGVRGASTISEQVVRIIHPRPRTVWSRWLEGFEAAALERSFSKGAILEFYLNQVPYAARRRGVVQAARYYFDRDLDTLNTAEMLALAVMVRAPGRLDLFQGEGRVGKAVQQLAGRLAAAGLIPDSECQTVLRQIELQKPAMPVQASHFVRYIYSREIPRQLLERGRLATTLDASLQGRFQSMLDGRLHDLRSRQVHNGAVLVLDHASGEVLAWVNGGEGSERPGSQIDAVLTPRQPGSTLKPFLYAQALEKGWSAATIIDDSPLAGQVGTGQHQFRNYSRQNYGPLRLRDCLGNSLNIPAVRTVHYLGYDSFLQRLRQLGFASLSRDADFYGEGLALGNGEVTLFELVQAYATLARLGVYRPLQTVLGEVGIDQPRRVYGEEDASLIAHILSDPEARRLEFGSGNLLNFPVQTAVKTGTSTDYRDAWAVGFSQRYTVGVWMGNLDRQPMQGVTGSIGSALLLRSVFAELNRSGEGKPLYLSPRLSAVAICQLSGELAQPGCPTKLEWFAPGRAPTVPCSRHGGLAVGTTKAHQKKWDGAVHLEQPTPGLQLAMDPRIPAEMEAFPLQLPKEIAVSRVEWLVDGVVVGTTGSGVHRFLWSLMKGRHQAAARFWGKDGDEPRITETVQFMVK